MADIETKTTGPGVALITDPSHPNYDIALMRQVMFSYPPPLRRTFEKGELTSIALRGLGVYVKIVDAVNRAVGYVAMYLLVVMLGILVWAVFTAGVLKSPSIWVMEMAQFTMAAYYLLGAAFSMQHKAHVRMDFLYERWSPRRRAITDALTAGFVLFYLVVLVVGGWQSSAYALEYSQRNHTVWQPYMAPIKIIMTTGMFLMLLQSVSELIKDIAIICGKEVKWVRS
jgi:TRAP-type mannitol/chloroaromatic compound transport system permease small subunit